jgi:hypothetical protein
MDTITVGSIWKESDKRFERFVRVMRTAPDAIQIRTCDESGAFKPGTRASQANPSRFGKAGGYSFVRSAP